ncbi:DNA (cytosine-5-)-methyltransferase [Acinetobacter baumannii]
MKAISLFSGAGGMDVGMSSAGFFVKIANEIDQTACKTYIQNHKDALLIEGDLDENLDKFNNLSAEIDLIFGGPPCQGFSVAGKMDIHDPRSKLVFSFLEVVRRVLPKAFVMENVKALGSLDKFSHIRQEIVNQANEMGYSVSLIHLNAKDFGVPQSRERIFFIGLKNSEKVTLDDFKKYQKHAPSIREVISHLGKAGSANNPHITNAKITLAKNPVLRKSAYAGMLFNGQGRPLNPDSWSSTLPASMGGNRTPIIDENHLYHYEQSWVEKYHQLLINGEDTSNIEVPKSLRRLTIDEAKIIQTFPENYKFCGTQSKIFTQIGNAVPCKLAEVVGLVVKSKIGSKLNKSYEENTQAELLFE